MIYRYSIKDKTETDVAGLNDDFVKFKNDKEDKFFESIEDFFIAFFSEHNLKYESIERFDDNGGVYFVLINGGEFIYFEELDSDDDTVPELTQDRSLMISENKKNYKIQETIRKVKQKAIQEAIQQNIQLNIQQNINQKYLIDKSSGWDNELDDEWDCER